MIKKKKNCCNFVSIWLGRHKLKKIFSFHHCIDVKHLNNESGLVLGLELRISGFRSRHSTG